MRTVSEVQVNKVAQSAPSELGAEARLSLLQSLRGTGKTLRLRTDGISMSPMMESGSIVTIEFAPAADLRAGDMILFAREDRLVLHRLLRLKKGQKETICIEKGDHQPFASEIPIPSVLGRAIEIATSQSTFDSTSASGRRTTRRLLMYSRAEHALYRIKCEVFGTRPTRAGRIWMRGSNTVRKWLGVGRTER